jgi:glycosyltransferase involved in cell wall biosynthesis
VQSLVNLVRNLHTSYDLYIVCKPHEMNETGLLKGISINEWTDWEGKVKVYYWNYSFSKRRELMKLFNNINPHTVFINGLYSLYFNLLPLRYSLKKSSINVVWSARGMLHSGALAQKSFKKKLFLSIIKAFNIHKKVTWHATDEREVAFIQQTMGGNVKVMVAGNFPNFISASPVLHKEPGQLIIGTVALISPMKNHKAIIEALQQCTASVKWFIYGPVKDENYWQECLQLIHQLPANVEVVYKGELPPPQLSTALAQLHVFIMPSESENFGHAILEALSAGKPVITTTTTPFHQLTNKKAGVALELKNLSASLTQSIHSFSAMSHEEYNSYCERAAAFAKDHVSVSELTQQYRQLFQNNH